VRGFDRLSSADVSVVGGKNAALGERSRALKRIREERGLTKGISRIPFCRTPEEAEQGLKVVAKNELKRHTNGLQVSVRWESPSTGVLAKQVAERFDGLSLGSNELTQLVLGVDRDATDRASLFDERPEAVKETISDLSHSAHKGKRKVGIWGQAPRDSPESFMIRGLTTTHENPGPPA
jgi:pyruvate,water dikinase